jgi:hypothetical protein
MLKNILALERIIIIEKQQQKEINGGIIHCDPCNLFPGQTCHLSCPKPPHNN